MAHAIGLVGTAIRPPCLLGRRGIGLDRRRGVRLSLMLLLGDQGVRTERTEATSRQLITRPTFHRVWTGVRLRKALYWLEAHGAPEETCMPPFSSRLRVSAAWQASPACRGSESRQGRGLRYLVFSWNDRGRGDHPARSRRPRNGSRPTSNPRLPQPNPIFIIRGAA